MANNSSYGGILLSIWLMGGTVPCYVAAMLAMKVIIPPEPIVFLVFTIVGAVFLVLGLGLLLLNVKKLGSNDPAESSMKKSMIGLMLLTIVADAVLIVVANS